jgi:type IV pilus assembly protein PilX
MVKQSQDLKSAQFGMVLIASLLLLLIVTIIGLALFRNFGLQERIAGNTRDKQRALQAAISTENYAEFWLANKSDAPFSVVAGLPTAAAVACTTGTVTTEQICSNTLASLGITVTSGPWNAGVLYTPVTMNVTGNIADSTVKDVYFQRPRFYITDLGAYAGRGHSEVYRIDAVSSGVSPNTVAVVESTVVVTCLVCNVGAM